MRTATWAWALCAALLLTACCCPESTEPCAPGEGLGAPRAGEIEEAIPLWEVPESVLAAGRAAKPGIVFEEAVREVEHGLVVYELQGEVDGEDWEVEVTADGRVLEVEPGDDDEDGPSGKSTKSEKSGKSVRD